jgi:hypothetical protein
MQQAELGTMAAQPSTLEFNERRPLQEFRVSTRMLLPLQIINLQIDYDEGLWIVTLPPLDAAASSEDFQEARQMLFEYIDFLWNEYVLCPVEYLGEAGKMQRELLRELFSVS